MISEEREIFIDPFDKSATWSRIYLSFPYRAPLFSSEYFYYHPLFGTRIAVFKRNGILKSG
jgi:hypothetical protein